MNLKIEVSNHPSQSNMSLQGEIDIYTAPQVVEKLLPLTKHAELLIEVDFKDVTYMDSTGLGVFISALKSTKENGSYMKLINLSDRLLRLFTITGLDKIIDISAQMRGEINE